MLLSMFFASCWKNFILFFVFSCSLGVFSPSFLIAAENSFECQRVWDAPSKNNDVLSCFKDVDHLVSQWRSQIFVYASLLLLAVTVLIIPFFCCGCFCCCASCKHKPRRHSDYCKAIFLACIVLLGAVAVGILMFSGAAVAYRTLYAVYDDIRGGLLDYVADLKDQILQYLINYTTNPPTAPSIDVSEFDTVVNEIRSKTDEYYHYFHYSALGYSLVGVLGGALVLLLALIVLFSVLCECELCACGFGWFIYFIAVVLCIISALSAVVAYAVSGICGEVQLQFRRFPGIFQWYLLPFLKSEIDFAEISQTVSEMEGNAAEEACRKLLSLCHPPGTSSSLPFLCPDNVSSSTTCQTFREVETIYEGVYMDPTLIASNCPRPSNHQGTWVCTIDECASYCSNTATKTAAQTVSSLAAYARNASVSVSLILPLENPNFALDVASSLLISRKFGDLSSYTNQQVTRCSDLHTSAYIITTGFFVGAILLLFGLLALLWIRQVYEDDKAMTKIDPLRKSIESQEPMTLLPATQDDYGENIPPQGAIPSAPTIVYPDGEQGVLCPVVSWY